MELLSLLKSWQRLITVAKSITAGILMQKLIVTVTMDGTISYPGVPHQSETSEELAEEFYKCYLAGASIAHIHGPVKKRKQDEIHLSTMDVSQWKDLSDRVREKCDGMIIQFGIAHGKLEDRRKIMELKPDMMSINLCSHDTVFDGSINPHFNPKVPRRELYQTHTRDELEIYLKLFKELGIKPELEIFQLGGLWNFRYLLAKGLVDEPYYFNLVWEPGGLWAPHTPRELLYRVENLPANSLYTVTVFDPMTQLQLEVCSLVSGGQVRVGFEDNPYYKEGEFAKSNAQLVERIAKISKEYGREIATPEEARKMLNLRRR